MEALKAWAIAAMIRALKSAAQAVLVLMGTDMVNILTVDWVQIAGVAAGMAVASIVTSIAGIPEVEGGANVAKLAKGGE